MSFAAKLVRIENPEDASEDERNVRRYRVQLDAIGLSSALGQTSIKVHDLSTEGFLVESDSTVEIGNPISVELPGTGAVAARVVWASGRLIGGRFDRLLLPAEVRAAVAQSRVVWPDFANTAHSDSSQRSSAGQALVDAQRPGPSRAGELSYSGKLRIILATSLLFWTAAGGAVWAFA